MTPEERADEIMGRSIPDCACFSLAWHVRTLIAMAVSEAVAEEREACAALAEAKIERDWDGIGLRDDDLAQLASEIGAAIRGREQTSPVTGATPAVGSALPPGSQIPA